MKIKPVKIKHNLIIATIELATTKLNQNLAKIKALELISEQSSFENISPELIKIMDALKVKKMQNNFYQQQ